MPNFNGAKFVAQAISSVQLQTEQDWELLVSDDGSSDDSLRIIDAFADRDPRIKLLAGSSQTGPARTRNRAIMAASGRYLAFLDSDDQWAERKLELQLQMQRERDCALTFTAMRKMNAGGELHSRVVLLRREVAYRDLLARNYLPCSSVIVDRARTGDVYMPDIFRRQDFALWLQILRNTGDRAYACVEPLLFYRVYPESFSASKLVGAAYHWKVLRQYERVSPIPAAYYFSNYAIGAGFEYMRGRLQGAQSTSNSHRL